jgi:mevalonate kinase
VTPPRTASACAKAILFGEHAVVYGVPALAIPITSRRLVVELALGELRPDAQPAVATPDVRIEGGAALGAREAGVVRAMVARALEQTPRGRGPRVGVRLDSTIPLSAGLGSSAALAVALVRALAPDLPARGVAQRANALEELAHGTPSGIDAHCIAFGQALSFTRGQPFRFLRARGPLRLAVAVLPREGTTASLVAGVRALREAGDPRFERFLAAARAQVERALAWFVDADAPGEDALAPLPPEAELGALMDEAHASLEEVGVSSSAQGSLCAALRSAGALGAKLSGAGGGGATLALLPAEPDPDRERAVLAAAHAAGATDAFVTSL